MILLTSAGHSPGVTGLAVALAVTSPEPVLLVDANREPDQSVLAGHLQGVDPGGRGLGGMLRAHRERRALALSLDAMTLPLDGVEGHDFLPGFSHPGMVSLFGPVWPELAAVLEATGRTVLVDAGRITPEGLPSAMVTACSGVAVVTGSRLVDLAALRLYLPLVMAAGEERVGLVVVGPGRPYGSGEIGHQFGVGVWGKLAWRPAESAVFAAGEPAPRRLMTSDYLDDVRALGEVLAARAAGRKQLIGKAKPVGA